MSGELRADFEKRFASGTIVRAALDVPMDRFSVTVLFGPSGCGKTTILRSLAGLERPEVGHIRCGETTWLDAASGVWLSPQRRGIGLLTQDLAMFPHLTVARNIGYGLSGVGKAERTRRVGELMTLLKLDGLANRYPHQVSGGQQQRVALARAVAPRPRLLLLDEPLSALDAPTREQLRRELRNLLAVLAIPTVAVTHDAVEAIALADRLVVVDRGGVLQSGSVQEVFARPASIDVARIVGVETVVPGVITQAVNGLATVAIGETELTAVANDAPVGPVFVCIRAEDVTLLRGDAIPSSARNRLAGKVVAVEPHGPLLRIGLDCGFPLTALITRPACEELGLKQDEQVTALVKAPAVHLIPRG